MMRSATARAPKLLLRAVLSTAALWSIAVPATAAEIPRIAVLLHQAMASPAETGLREGLREHGYVEGQNIRIEWRRSSGSIEDARPDAAEMVRSRADLLLALSTSHARAAMEATSTTPIIFLSADPVATGLAESLARPGANATGVSVASPELAAKRLDLLHQLVPQARRIAFLLNPSNAAIALTSAEAQKAASTLGLRLEKFDARNAAEIDASLRAIQRSAPDAILVASDLTLLKDSARIASGVRKARVPAVFPWREYHEHGVLMSYGPDFRQVTRRLASYVDRILKGANPGDLPVEEVSKFDLVVDLRVARELKIDVPQSLLLRADEVIR